MSYIRKRLCAAEDEGGGAEPLVINTSESLASRQGDITALQF